MAQTVAIQQHLSGDGGKLCSPLSVAFIKDNMFVDNKVIAFLLETRPRIRPEGALKLAHKISGYVSRIFPLWKILCCYSTVNSRHSHNDK